MSAEDLKSQYAAILAESERHGLAAHLVALSRQWADGLFNAYEPLLAAVPVAVNGHCVVDFGCKCGHLLPMLIAKGARQAIGLDAEETYVEAGRRVIAGLYPKASVLKTDCGYIPLQPETADVVIMNEVISHVNPAFLDTVWRESARILRPGGLLFISDGNNAANANARRKLVDLYEKWENGPEGAETDRDVVMDHFLKLRRELIRTRHPDMGNDAVEYAARNTSGLFGEQLGSTVDHFVKTGELIRRPYVRGVCPVNPNPSGVVMERAFFPQQLELALAEYGFSARQVVPAPYSGRQGLLGPAKDVYAWIRHRLRTILDPQWHRSAYEGFQIVAFKG
jgi:SAM-dependent methyltransferase